MLARIRAIMVQSLIMALPGSLEIDAVARQGAGHAVAAAAAAAQLGADDGDDVDTGLAQQGVGVGVAVVGDDNPWFESHQVVAAVPLLPGGGVDVAAGLDDAELAEPPGLGIN